MRIGHGYDVHRLTEGRKLILGGVEIPYKLGLDGHSDADVIVHALMDALLGALALGDIGQHFPDTDPDYKGADSLKLLDKVCEFVDDSEYVFSNADITVCCQEPKLAPYITQMRANIAETMDCDIGQISIKATTEEHLGFTGEGLGISATAVVLLEEV